MSDNTVTDTRGNVISPPAPREATITDRGTALHLQVGRPEDYASDPRQAAADRNRSGVDDSASLRVSATGEVERFGGVTRAVAGQPLADTGNVMDTARHPVTLTPARVIDRKTMLHFGPGADIDVATAIGFGWIRPNGNGGYEPTGRHVAEVAALSGKR